MNKLSLALLTLCLSLFTNLHGDTLRDPIHIALVSGCDSHMSGLTPVAYSLLHHASTKNKYRITFVTGRQCKSIADDLGADFHDSGFWYFSNYPLDTSYFEVQRNLTYGPVLYAIPGVESLMKRDKPDIVLASMFSAYVSIIAEEYNVQYATVWFTFLAHPAIYQAGIDVNQGLAGIDYSPSPDSPKWLRAAVTDVLYAQLAVNFWLVKYDALRRANEILVEKGIQKQYQDVLHLINSFPAIALTGPPLFPYSEVPGKFFIAGMQPMTSPKESVMNVDLKDFIKQSDRDIIYISMGTHAYLEDAQFQVMKDALMKQTHFNVIWSHSDWNEQKYGDKIDSKRLFVRKKQPQKEILKQPKVKVFLSHCGASSLNEGVYNLKVFIGCPQIRDQFIASKAITNNNLGNVISSSPTEQEILASIEDIWNNYPVYSENVKNLQKNLTSGSVERLERIIDYLVEQEKPIQFDVNETNVMPLWKAWLILGVCFLPFLTVFALVLTGLIWCIKKLRGQNKEKRNSKHRSAKSKKIN